MEEVNSGRRMGDKFVPTYSKIVRTNKGLLSLYYKELDPNETLMIKNSASFKCKINLLDVNKLIELINHNKFELILIVLKKHHSIMYSMKGTKISYIAERFELFLVMVREFYKIHPHCFPS